MSTPTSGESPTARLRRQIEFIVECDRLKEVFRQTINTASRRAENDAEHSWALCLCVIVLAEHANQPGLDLLRVLKMVILHDLVEIDAGDTFAYDTTANADKEDRERRAAERLFGLLPADQAEYFWRLWEEYEAQETSESRFANAVDRLQPAMLNHQAGDESPWKRHGVTVPQAMKRLAPIGDGADALWAHTQQIIRDAHERGHLRAD